MLQARKHRRLAQASGPAQYRRVQLFRAQQSACSLLCTVYVRCAVRAASGRGVLAQVGALSCRDE
eukprot:7015789-Lingulodinium_polyedra.AAC.1